MPSEDRSGRLSRENEIGFQGAGSCQPILIERVMSTKVLTVDFETPLREVIKQVRLNRVSCVIVFVEDAPVGIISERRLVAVFDDFLNGRATEEQAAVDMMSAPLVTVPHSATVHESLLVAEEASVRHLVVLDKNHGLAGVITQTNLLHALTWDLEIARQQHKVDVDELINLVRSGQS